ncbi:DoxX family protein [Labrys sp. La1]|uniref:DoxX family protein n=1 Tax=Labrys sp. La1 TaxID=3404917 RepID=UPI003EBE27C2
MPISETRPKAWSASDLSVPAGAEAYLMLGGRVLLAVIFVVSGVRKIVEFDFFLAYMKAFGVPASSQLLPLAAAFEIIVGMAFALGIATRLCAVLLFLETLLLNSIFHNFWTYPLEQRLAQLNLFLFHLATLGGFLYVIAHGGGRFSLSRPDQTRDVDQAEAAVK